MKTNAWIFDLDGTLADGEHRIHHIKKEPKDWRTYFSLCYKDQPIEHMVKLARELWSPNYGGAVLVVSGRSDEVRVETIEWLDTHQVPYDRLYMRRAGDYRPDNILKIEMLEQIRADGFEPIMAFDDRARVVQAWRAAGIPCAQVAEGDF